MIPEVQPGVFASISKRLQEKGLGHFLEEFVREQPNLAVAFFDQDDAKMLPIIMLYFGIKSQMEADALNE